MQRQVAQAAAGLELGAVARRQLAVFQREHVDAVGAEIRAQDVPAGRVEQHHVGVRRLLARGVGPGAGVLEQARDAAQPAVRADRQHVVRAAAVQCHGQVLPVRRHRHVRGNRARQRQRLPVQQRQPAVARVDGIGLGGAGGAAFVDIDLVDGVQAALIRVHRQERRVGALHHLHLRPGIAARRQHVDAARGWPARRAARRVERIGADIGEARRSRAAGRRRARGGGLLGALRLGKLERGNAPSKGRLPVHCMRVLRKRLKRVIVVPPHGRTDIAWWKMLFGS